MPTQNDKLLRIDRDSSGTVTPEEVQRAFASDEFGLGKTQKLLDKIATGGPIDVSSNGSKDSGGIMGLSTVTVVAIVGLILWLMD